MRRKKRNLKVSVKKSDDKDQNLPDINYIEPQHFIKSPDDDFFFGLREGVDPSARMFTGMFGKTIIVDEVRFTPFNGPPCVQPDQPQTSHQCDSCEYFSPSNCLLRLDEFLLDDINRLSAIRSEHTEIAEKKRRAITKAIYRELKAHGRALHYTVITKIMMARYPKFQLKAHSVYHYLVRHPELFERVDAGVYRAK